MRAGGVEEIPIDARSINMPEVSDVAVYLILDPFKSEFHTCPTMGLDETTLDGTAKSVRETPRVRRHRACDLGRAGSSELR